MKTKIGQGKNEERTEQKIEEKESINDLWQKGARKVGEATLKWRKKGFRQERGGQALSLREVNKDKNTDNCLLSFQFSSVKRVEA